MFKEEYKKGNENISPSESLLAKTRVGMERSDIETNQRQKSFKPVLIAAVVSTLLLTATIGAVATHNGLWFHKEEVTDVYVFPYTPDGTPEKWKKLSEKGKARSACQIPENILSAISTKGLIETCLNYPFFADIYAYNSFLQGMDAVTGGFNGFQELNNRPDTAKELLNYYKNIDYDKIVNSNDPYYILRVTFFDFYMAQDKFLLNLSVEERRELLEVCKNSINIIENDYSDTFNKNSLIYLAACILQIDDENFKELIANNQTIQYSLETGMVTTELIESAYLSLGIDYTPPLFEKPDPPEGGGYKGDE